MIFSSQLTEKNFCSRCATWSKSAQIISRPTVFLDCFYDTLSQIENNFWVKISSSSLIFAQFSMNVKKFAEFKILLGLKVLTSKETVKSRKTSHLNICLFPLFKLLKFWMVKYLSTILLSRSNIISRTKIQFPSKNIEFEYKIIQSARSCSVTLLKLLKD